MLRAGVQDRGADRLEPGDRAAGLARRARVRTTQLPNLRELQERLHAHQLELRRAGPVPPLRGLRPHPHRMGSEQAVDRRARDVRRAGPSTSTLKARRSRAASVGSARAAAHRGQPDIEDVSERKPKTRLSSPNRDTSSSGAGEVSRRVAPARSPIDILQEGVSLASYRLSIGGSAWAPRPIFSRAPSTS